MQAEFFRRTIDMHVLLAALEDATDVVFFIKDVLDGVADVGADLLSLALADGAETQFAAQLVGLLEDGQVVHDADVARRVDISEFMDWCLACGVNPEEAFQSLRRQWGL